MRAILVLGFLLILTSLLLILARIREILVMGLINPKILKKGHFVP